ncbi:CZB domain-containing protein [Teredinibacter haidensis]|uniref:CZB domain-containing protein n=1 Tax=Teredinibacter haidensis TaxID=2731755 RepID=UPI000948E811|nr:CZB domain-containing protein [Teredinibacter haidensis]
MEQQAVTTDTHNAGSYLTFKAGDMHFALSVHHVRYIAALSSLSTRTVPGHNGAANSVFDFDGKAIGLYPLNKIVGAEEKTNESVELIKLLETRRQDHIDWINALEHSIRTGAHFDKARDSHQCAFGIWYDQYKPEDSEMESILSLFDKPHKLIHSIADRLLSMAHDDHRIEDAIEILNKTRDTTLHHLLELFDQATARLKDLTKPVVLVLEDGGKIFALELEQISDIKEFSAASWLPDQSQQQGDFGGYDGFFQTQNAELFLNIVPHKLLKETVEDFG